MIDIYNACQSRPVQTEKIQKTAVLPEVIDIILIVHAAVLITHQQDQPTAHLLFQLCPSRYIDAFIEHNLFILGPQFTSQLLKIGVSPILYQFIYGSPDEVIHPAFPTPPKNYFLQSVALMQIITILAIRPSCPNDTGHPEPL